MMRHGPRPVSSFLATHGEMKTLCHKTFVERAMIVPAGRKRFTSSYEMVKHTIVEISAIVAAQLRKISLCGVAARK
jgi:hypothetical protein